MEKFGFDVDIENNEFVSIEEIDGKKVIHVIGYYYSVDNGDRHISFNFAYIPIADLKGMNSKQRFNEIYRVECCCDTYIDDIDDMVADAKKSYEGCFAVPITDIDENTENGIYFLK